MEIHLSLVRFLCKCLCYQEGENDWNACQYHGAAPTSHHPFLLLLPFHVTTGFPQMSYSLHFLGMSSAECSALTALILATLALPSVLSNVLSLFYFLFKFMNEQIWHMHYIL